MLCHKTRPPSRSLALPTTLNSGLVVSAFAHAASNEDDRPVIAQASVEQFYEGEPDPRTGGCLPANIPLLRPSARALQSPDNREAKRCCSQWTARRAKDYPSIGSLRLVFYICLSGIMSAVSASLLIPGESVSISPT